MDDVCESGGILYNFKKQINNFDPIFAGSST
jgi:hypothetical protein